MERDFAFHGWKETADAAEQHEVDRMADDGCPHDLSAEDGVFHSGAPVSST